MYCLIYESTSSVPYQEVQVANILESSRAFNRINDVTGVLFFYRNRFVQYIEGNEDTIQQLYVERIAKDSRHTNLNVLGKGAIEERLFGNWDMKFCYLNEFDINLESLLVEKSFNRVIESILTICANEEAVNL